jgi:hypothetical protein
MNEKEFIGVVGERTFYILAIRQAFNKEYFNLCDLHHLPKFNNSTFAKWVQNLHCRYSVDENTLNLAKLYCINYFLCPESEDEFEVEAYMREIFHKENKKSRTIFKIGQFKLIKD